MTHESTIDKKINDEFEELRNAKYDGAIPPPKELLRMFRKALMEVPFDHHQLNMVTVREIIDADDISEISLMNLGIIANFVNKVPPRVLFDSPYKYCEYMIAHNAFVACYNPIIKEYNDKLEKKKAAMKNTSGIIRNPNKTTIGGGRIISANR